MKISLSLLKKFIDIKLSSEEIADQLTNLGIEVDSILNESPSFSKVVAAKVIDTKEHPSADKLSIATVYDGKKSYQVVCAAPNCKKGLITAFAPIGATLLDDKENLITIKKTKIRDIESFGMLCSAKELKLFDEKDTILELDDSFKLGQDLTSLSEPVFEISLTPNLGRCMSAIGIARELASALNTKIKMFESNIKEAETDINKKVKVIIKDNRCKRYTCRLIENIKVEKSPFWLKSKIEKLGLRSVNNIVDALNLVMLKFNQPMHAFDFDKINREIQITTNTQDVNIMSLDEIERKIPKDSLLISDGKKTIAVAGIIGTLNSSVDENTKNILLESAYFDNTSIRTTSKQLFLKTESSMRFEKGTDPDMPPIALDYAAALIVKTTKGSIAKGKIDIKKDDFKLKKIKCRLSKIQQILGTKISLNEALDIFKRLEFNILKSTDNEILLEIPNYRNDLFEEIDLIEEIARIFGYNNITKVRPTYCSSNIYHSDKYLFEKNLKTYLRSSNLQEIITCDLISPKLAEISYSLGLNKKELAHVIHYKSIDQSILRPSMLPSFLEIVKYNHDHKNFDLSMYETSHLHFKKDNKIIERWALSLILCGKKAPQIWEKQNFEINFYDLKGILENIFSAVVTKDLNFTKSTYSALHPGRQANIKIASEEIGILGEVHPKILKEMDIKKRVLFAEINLDLVYKNKKDTITYQDISQYPATQRDLTIPLDAATEIDEIFNYIKSIKSPVLEKVDLIDIFKTTENTKNVTFRFTYRDKFKTILFDTAEKEHEKITKEIKKQI